MDMMEERREREDSVSEDDQFFFSRAPRMPEDDIIMSEVATLTGGRDQHGRPIIALPAKYHNILESKVKASGMDSLLRYFIDITRVADRKRGFAFVTDLRFSTLDFILLMKSILNSIQAEMKGAIGTCVLYAILPLNKKTHKNTLTHLALRQSKKKINKNIIPPYFQSVAVDDEVELYNYIEKSHLTPDLGGYLQYSHKEWVAFRRIVEPFFANFESVQVRLSNAYQRLAAMAKTKAGNSKEQLQQTHNQLQDAYYDIRRGLQLDVVLDQCEDLRARFGSCDEEDVFTVLAQKPILKETKQMVEGCHDQLVAANKKIEDDWDDMSRRITQALQLIEYREDVTQLLDWFKTRKERDLEGGADIADNLSRAEMLCNHFETGLLVKTEEKLSKAYDVMHHGERLAVDNNNRSLSEITQLTKTLKQDAQDFQNAVQKHQHILQSVYQFHQLYNKARRWYISCIKFLPSDLNDLYNGLRSHSRGNDHQALKLQWEEDVRRFLHKQTLPAKEELKKVKMIPEDIGATSLKKKGRLLSYRCIILTNLLSHKENISTANIKEILKWQSEIQLRSDDSTSQQSEISPSGDQIKKTASESSLDTRHQNQRHRKPEGKSRSKKSSKKTQNEDDSYHRHTQTPERTRRHNGPRDTYPDTHSNTVDDTDNDDPLIQRLGHPGSFYDRYGDTQGQIMGEGYDEADDGRDNWEDAQRNQHSERMSNGAIEYAQQSSPSLPTVPASQFARDRSQSRQSTSEHGQTYGIYGDSDVEDDTAVIIHHQGPPHPPQGLPEHMLPGNQMLHQGHPPSGSHHFAPSLDPSNVALGNERLSYGLIQQDPTQFQSRYTNSRQTPQLDSHGVHPQNGHILPHAVLYNHHNGTPADLNTNNNSSLNSNMQAQSHGLRGNHARPGLSPSYVNGMTSPKRSPMSFHGSLMNIHQSYLDNDYSAMGGQDSNETMSSSPVTRHRSLMNLSHSPIMDQTSNANVQYSSMQTSPVRSDNYVVPSQNRSNGSQHNGEIHSAEQGIQNPYNSTSLRMRHGVSEPSVNLVLRDTTSPYSTVLENLMHLREANTTRPIQLTKRHKTSRSKKMKTLPSSHSLSRSEMDLRYIPQGPSPPNGLSHSEHALHHSGRNHGQILSNSLMATADPSAVLTSQNASLRGDEPDPQVEYYKKLYSGSTPHKNHSTTASGHRKTNHTLDPSTHAWMHDIPSTHTRHQGRLSARLPQTSPPLSPLALLEMEVAKETMDAEEALKEDEYNEEQMRRQVLIDSILNQSESNVRSHDVRASQDQLVSYHGHSSRKPGKRQKHVKLLGSPRKEDGNMLRNASHSDASVSRSQHYAPLKHNASEIPVTSKFNKMGQSENGWREHHPSDPSMASLGIHHSTPTYHTQRRPVVTPRGLSRTERHLGLSTTLPQEENIQAVNASNELDQRPRLVGEPGFETADHSAQVYGHLQTSTPLNTAGESFGKSSSLHQSYRPSSRNEEVDWRQEHLRELGLSPRIQHPVLNPSLNLSNHANQSEYNTDWRLQHLQDLGITPSVPHSSLGYNPARSGTKDNERGHEHLTEARLSQSMHHSTPKKTSGGLSDSSKDWRRQHLLELGISPSEHLSGNLNSIARKNTTGVGSNSTMRHDVSKLGISPSLHQHPVRSAVESGVGEGNIAPMTSRLRGVLESGQSLNDVEEIHHLAEETAKKSVRFAHLSEETILDAEERAQEELADRLHQLELKLQEEEYSLMYQDVLDGETESLDQQLIDLDQQEEAMLSNTNHQQTDPQRLLEGDVRLRHIQNGRLYQQGVLQPQHVNRRDLDQQEKAWQGHTGRQGMREGAVGMTHVQNGHRNQHALRESILQPHHIQNRQHIQVSQHPDETLLGHPVNLPDLQNIRRNQLVAKPSHQQALEEVVQPMRVQSSQQKPSSEHPGHEVLPDRGLRPMLAKTGQSQGADQHSGRLANPSSAETTNQVKTKSPVGRPGTDRTADGSPLKVTERQSDRHEHQLSHNRKADVRDSMDRVNINVANDKPLRGQNLTKAVGQSGTESTDERDHSFRAAQGKDENSVNHEKVVTDQVVVPGRHAAASDTRQERGSGMVEDDELVNNPAGPVSSRQETKTCVSVLPDGRYGGKSIFLSEEEQKKSTREPYQSEKSVPHPTNSPQTLVDELNNKPAVKVSSRHTDKYPASVGPDIRYAGESRFPGEKELNQLTGEFEVSVTHPMNIPQTLDNSKDLKKDESYSDSNEMIYELDEVIPSEDTTRASSLERDHTAADYIACALGMDYVNKKNLTVQPFSNSSKSTTQQPDEHLNRSENQGYSQSKRSQGDATQDIQSSSTKSDSKSQNMDSKDALRGIGSSDKDDINIRGLYNPHINIPKTQVSLEEGPCSPIRKWLKEKETSEVRGIKPSQSEPNLTGKVDNERTTDYGFANSVESPINAAHIKSPPMSSQSTSPIRQWLREKQENEAHQSREVKDFASPNSSVTDGGLGNASNSRPNTQSIELENSEDLKQSPNYIRGRTHSLIPVPVGSQRAGDSQKQTAKSQSPHETRRRSSSAIPVYKGLSKSSQKPREASPSVSSVAGGKSPETDHVTHDVMQKADIKSKKSNPYSKIPVKKVYTTLKAGGYLEDTSQLKEQNSPQQVSPSEKSLTRSAVEHSESEGPETPQSRPVLERQGTFTKEPRPTLTREGTFTIEGEDENRQSESLFFPSEDAVAPSNPTEEKNAQQSTFSPLALVLDHMVRKGSAPSTSTKREMSGGKKHHDSAEETFENSSTESSMSPTTKSTIIASNKPTTNVNNTRNYYINVGNHRDNNQGEVTGSKAIGHEVGMDTYDGLTESDRKEHDELDENELQKMMATKGQLAEIRNLEIENRHLAYERKEFEAHLIKNMQHQQAHTSDEG
ncbi:uncharacterized protein LOC119725814 isoform X2 [Patiria miniata]|uniref:CRAL-TRIO domain-containing protein n=1 Tax=Patiria miniata TaxID=46514 RepID=A0A913ZQH8_PATMI|nr:uncharacterized protein LOC119725814 isoform X2 [Patiria miniata]